jgi:imidazolonepropionase-like amidohydrolase
VIENNRITDIAIVGNPGVPIVKQRPKAKPGARELQLDGYYVLPGFIDMHGHLGGSAKDVPAEYVLKLWLSHGITTVREPGSFQGLEWTVRQQQLSERNAIAAPRIIPYVGFGMGRDKPFSTPQDVKQWVDEVAKKGARGIKFFGARPDLIKAAIERAQKHKMGTTMHHAQVDVVRMNALTSARLGLNSMEHWYGLPEALFTHQVIQDYPADYLYHNEQHRFGEAGKLWLQAAEPGSEKWNQVRDELIALDFTLDPTFTIYEASRDLMRERNADWHKEYTLPSLWQFFEPSRYAHGSYWFDWTTQDEINWKNNFRRWMTFVNDYKNHGGRVTTGSDSGYIYKIYGFGYIRELELLQEAGFHPLEVIKSATLNGAELLGMDDRIGSIEVGKLADLVVVKENPLRNFKVLYGTGHFMLDDNNQPTRTQGIRYTIKDGIVYDVQQLLADVRAIVKRAKQQQLQSDSAAIESQ